MTTIELAIDGIPSGALDPWEAVGTGAISSLYSFDIGCNLLGDRPDAGIVGRDATLTMTPTGGSARVVHGIVDGMRIASSIVASRPPIIRIRLVPRFSLQKLSLQSQIFGTTEQVTVADLIHRQMHGTLREGSLAAGREPALAYAMRLHRTYPFRDQVVQYEETNFDFIARQAERWGIFWFFENDGESEQIVFADDNVSAPFIEAPAPIDWHGWSAGSMPPHRDGTIQLLEAMHDQVSGNVYLHDYNEDTPNVDLTSERTDDGSGTGVWTETSRLIRTVEEGALFAANRAEAIEARKFRLAGRSTVPQLAAGHAFQLRDHPFDDWNQNYLVVSVGHHVRVPRPDAATVPDEATGYSNRFVIQPLRVPFRPERVTPRPRIAGLLSGRIEGNTDSTAPHIDDQGRYRVRMTYDLSNSPKGFGSRWVRLATPFAGDKDGLHFPLHPGTDVVVAHIDGNPDRPVIVGAMFNPATPSVVTSANPGHNRINFRSGMGLTAQGSPPPPAPPPEPAAPTTDGGNSVFLWASHQNANYAPNTVAPTPYQWLRLGANVDFTGLGGTTDVIEGSNAADGFDLATGGSGRLFAPRDLFLIRNGSTAASATPETKGDTNNRLIAITDNTLLIAHDGTITIGEASGATGRPTEIVINTSGNITQNAGATVKTNIGGHSFTTTQKDTYTLQYSNSISMTLDSKDTVVCGANSNIYIGLSASFVGGAAVSVVLGLNSAFSFAVDFKLVLKKIEMAILTSIELKPWSLEVKPKKVDITMLEDKLHDIKTEIGTVETTVKDTIMGIGDIRTNLGQVETSIRSVATDVKDVTTSIGSLASHISDIENKVGQIVIL